MLYQGMDPWLYDRFGCWCHRLQLWRKTAALGMTPWVGASPDGITCTCLKDLCGNIGT